MSEQSEPDGGQRRALEDSPAVYRQQTRLYRGLTPEEADVLARKQGRRLRVMKGRDVGRASLDLRRVNVRLGADGRVLEAWTDAAGKAGRRQ